MDIRALKIKAYEDMHAKKTINDEMLLELINKDIEKEKITEEDIKHIKEQL